ncbi:MAG: hypothetical protein GY829_15210 [Gammaproteobacteria bacterium]|nr:hypothetical protein [Gammaproteobacteria bacterium]
MTEQIINSKQSLDAYKAYLDIQFSKKHYLRMTCKTGDLRTLSQNAALHVFCTQVSEALNDAGFDFRVFVKPGYPVPFNENLVKEYLWRPIQKAITGKNSTTQPKVNEYILIYDALNLKLAEHGIHVPWPCKENMK